MKDFNEEWKSEVEENVHKYINQEMETNSFLMISEMYPAVPIEALIPDGMLQRVKEVKVNRLNKNICFGEVTQARSKMNKNGCAGPDYMSPEEVMHFGKNAITSLTDVYDKCWQEGVFLDVRKLEHRIFIPKPLKVTYNIPKAYRGINKMVVLGKLYERIGYSRLYYFMEEDGFIDAFQ